MPNISEIQNRTHDLLHRPGEEVAEPTDLHLGFIATVDGEELTEKADEDNYGRIPYAQGLPVDGETTNPNNYVFPDPSSSYDIEGIMLVEGNTIGEGRVWGYLLYDEPVTITSENRTITAGNFTSVGLNIGDAEIST